LSFENVLGNFASYKVVGSMFLKTP